MGQGTLEQSEQIKVGEQIFKYIDGSTTALAGQIYKQPVKEYTSRNGLTKGMLAIVSEDASLRWPEQPTPPKQYIFYA